MRLIFGHDEYIANAVGSLLGVTIHPPYTAIGFLDESENFRGGVVFNNYNGSNVNMTIYLPRVLRGDLRAIAHYVYVQLGCQRMTCITRNSNVQAKNVMTKGGFKFEAVLPSWFGSGKKNAGVQYRLERETALKMWMK